MNYPISKNFARKCSNIKFKGFLKKLKKIRRPNKKIKNCFIYKDENTTPNSITERSCECI